MFQTLPLVTVIIVSPLHLDYISITSYSNHISIRFYFIPLALLSIYKCNTVWSTSALQAFSALSVDLYYNFPFNSTFPPLSLSIILSATFLQILSKNLTPNVHFHFLALFLLPQHLPTIQNSQIFPDSLAYFCLFRNFLLLFNFHFPNISAFSPIPTSPSS